MGTSNRLTIVMIADVPHEAVAAFQEYESRVGPAAPCSLPGQRHLVRPGADDPGPWHLSAPSRAHGRRDTQRSR